MLVCHGIKKGLYAFFKSHRKEWNNIADREEMEEHIAQNLEQMQKKVHDELEIFINQVQIDRKQMNEAKVAREARKHEAILKYSRYTPHLDNYS